MIKEYKIILESDLCVSNGESYGSVIDTDVCYDKLGFPFIPAKRIKGCLRETAFELLSWGIIENESFIDEIFGKKGNNKSGKLIISDSVLKEHNFQSKYHKQDILEQYTYTRTQTAIDEDGTAKENSLRTIRVIKSGLTFFGTVELPDTESFEILEKCMKLLKHMGLNRTRGLGEVKVLLCDNYESDKFKDNYKIEIISDSINYKITLLSNSVFSDNDSVTSLDYIPGRSLLGFLIQINNNIISNSIIFENAYISSNNKRFVKNPSFLIQEKTKNDKAYIKFSKEVSEKDIYYPYMKEKYIFTDDYFESIEFINVEKEINYHHKRDDDIGIGGVDGNNFYQIESLSGNQEFIGKISGSKEELKNILKNLKKEQIIYLGKYKSSGYGKCKLEFFNSEKNEISSHNIIKGNKFVIEFISPVILYNKYAFSSIDIEDVKDYIYKYLNIENNVLINISNKNLKYTSLGGYNFTWNMAKPVIKAFDSGTTFIIEFSEKIEIDVSKSFNIGERIFEGYGEILFYSYDILFKNKEIKCRELNIEFNKENNIDEEILKQIELKQSIEEIKKTALENSKKVKISDINATTIGKLLMVCEEQETYYNFKMVVDSIKDIKKKNCIKEILSFDESIFSSRNIDLEKNYKIYMKTFLIQLKYKKRGEEYSEKSYKNDYML